MMNLKPGDRLSISTKNRATTGNDQTFEIQCWGTGDTLTTSLWYPSDDEPLFIEVDLDHVRAADSVRISYDFKRDGWRIEQASRFEWEVDEDPDRDWQEVFFVKAWARERPLRAKVETE